MFASSYTIKIVTPEIDPITSENVVKLVDVESVETQETYVVDVSENLTTKGEYRFYVKANKVNSDSSISSSEFYGEAEEEKLTHQKVVSLFKPTVRKDTTGKDYSEEQEGETIKYSDDIKYQGDDLVITFDEVGNAGKYVVSLYGSDEKFESETNVVSIPKTSLPKITTGAYENTAIQIIYAQIKPKDDDLYSDSSEYSVGYIFYQNKDKATLANLKIKNPYSSFVGEEEFDFCASSQAELNTLVYFATANRIAKLQLYQEFYTQEVHEQESTWFIMQDYIKKATETYYETKNIETYSNEERKTDDVSGKIILYINNKISGSPTEQDIAIDDGKGHNLNKQQIKQDDIRSFSKLDADDTKRYSVDSAEISAEDKVALPILKRLNENKTLNVYTSDQLYLAVQAGYYPVFVGETNAKVIWSKAIDVLVGTPTQLGIIDSTMTEVEKALAIFDWVCYHNNYDYNTVARSDEALSQRFRGFYLEGMFLDDGQAVCDGISKAYTLLCNMAGIYCYKVSGEGVTESGSEGHAWNKVGIYDSVEDKYTYYLVDCTWNDTNFVYKTEHDAIIELGYAVTHSYFDESSENYRSYFLTAEDSKHIAKNPVKLLESTEATESYDYYENTKVTLNGTEYDLVVSGSIMYGDEFMTQLKNDLEEEYALTGLNFFEIKIHKDNALTFYNKMLSTGNWYVFDSERNYEGYPIKPTSRVIYVIHKDSGQRGA